MSFTIKPHNVSLVRYNHYILHITLLAPLPLIFIISEHFTTCFPCKMASRKEKGPANRFYGPPDQPKVRSESRPTLPRKEKIIFHAENRAAPELKSSTAKNVLCITQQQDAPGKSPRKPQFDQTPSHSLSTLSVGDDSSSSSIKKTVVSLSDKRDASQFSSPLLPNHKVHVTSRGTFESTIPPLQVTSPESLFFSDEHVSPAWRKKIENAGTPPEQFLKAASPKLKLDAKKFGLSANELMQLRAQAWAAREKAYCRWDCMSWLVLIGANLWLSRAIAVSA